MLSSGHDRRIVYEGIPFLFDPALVESAPRQECPTVPFCNASNSERYRRTKRNGGELSHCRVSVEDSNIYGQFQVSDRPSCPMLK
jgi:hypothetical protein